MFPEILNAFCTSPQNVFEQERLNEFVKFVRLSTEFKDFSHLFLNFNVVILLTNLEHLNG